jgi:putative nucleotidyltransferase with HDIG domain
VTREQALETLHRFTKSEALRRHAYAVEASVRWYARQIGEDEELWGITALLHDFDYEIHPTLDKHPQAGAPILREQGYPEEVIEAIQAHAPHTGAPPATSSRGSCTLAGSCDPTASRRSRRSRSRRS